MKAAKKPSTGSKNPSAKTIGTKTIASWKPAPQKQAKMAKTIKQPGAYAEMLIRSFSDKDFNMKAADYKGKGVIPEILLRPTPKPKGGRESSEKEQADGGNMAYEMFDKPDDRQQSSLRPDRGDRSRNQLERSVTKRTPRDAPYSEPRRPDRPDRSRPRSTSARSREGDPKSKKKMMRKFIRNLLSNDQYQNPTRCPRAGVMLLLWIVFGIVAFLALTAGLKVRFRRPDVIEYDRHNYFAKVHLVRNNAAA